ncbi:hypothetical protein ACWD6I_29655, partial [Streptomyces sp. NPDC002454]
TKNVNSLRSVERAARFEIQRHAAVLNEGGARYEEGLRRGAPLGLDAAVRRALGRGAGPVPAPPECPREAADARTPGPVAPPAPWSGEATGPGA